MIKATWQIKYLSKDVTLLSILAECGCVCSNKEKYIIYTWNNSSTKSSWKRNIQAAIDFRDIPKKNLSKYIHLAWFCQVSRHTCQLQTYPSPTWDLSSPDTTNEFSFGDVQGSTWRSRNEKAEAMYQYIIYLSINLNASYFFIPYEQIQGTSPALWRTKNTSTYSKDPPERIVARVSAAESVDAFHTLAVNEHQSEHRACNQMLGTIPEMKITISQHVFFSNQNHLQFQLYFEVEI